MPADEPESRSHFSREWSTDPGGEPRGLSIRFRCTLDVLRRVVGQLEADGVDGLDLGHGLPFGTGMAVDLDLTMQTSGTGSIYLAAEIRDPRG